MQITYQETKADTEAIMRLRTAGLPPRLLQGIILGGTFAATSLLTLNGYWKAGGFFAFILVLALWTLWKRKPAGESPCERTVELNEHYYAHMRNGDVHQGAWITGLHFDSTDRYCIVKRDRIAVLVIPQRVLTEGTGPEFESMLKRLVSSARLDAPREPVPLWTEALRKPFARLVKYQLSPDDCVNDPLTKYDPLAEKPKKPPGRGCAYLWVASMVALFVLQVEKYGWDNDFSLGAVTLLTLGLVIAACLFWQQRAAKRMIRDSPSFFGCEQIFALDYQGMSLGSERGYTFVPWSNIESVMCGKKRMVGLTHTSGLLHFVPKRAFDDEQAIEDFMAFAHERIVEASAPVVEADLVEPRPESGNPYQPPSA